MKKVSKKTKKPSAKKTVKARQKKKVAAPKPVKATAKSAPKPAPPAVSTGTLAVRPSKQSFLSRLFGSRNPKEKVSLMEAKTSK